MKPLILITVVWIAVAVCRFVFLPVDSSKPVDGLTLILIAGFMLLLYLMRQDKDAG